MTELATTLTPVKELGSARHQALINHVISHYHTDERIRSVAVFGSIGSGTWHELSDVDLDIVTADDAAIVPAEEVQALFGDRTQILLASADSADVILDSLEELSIRWHPLATTSPNITSSLRTLSGELSDSEIRTAGEANREPPDEQRLLDQLVRDAIGARKEIQRGDTWSAIAYVDRMSVTLVSLLGRRVTLELDPRQPEAALNEVLAVARASFDLGPKRDRLLSQLRLSAGRGSIPALR